MSTPTRSILLLLCLAPLALPTAGCIVAAGAVGGYVLYDEVGAGGAVAHVTFDVDEVWPTSQAVLREISEEEVTVVSNVVPREASTRIDERTISVQVLAFDLDHSVLRVEAKAGGLPDYHYAKMVRDRILERLSSMDQG
jgi:hypothetical protein